MKLQLPSKAQLQPWTGLIISVLLLLCIGGLLFPSGGRDDAHITYWVARSFSHSGRMVNYNGDPIEQSSSLLHVLSLGLLHRLCRLDMVILGRLFSVFFGAASLVALYNLVERSKAVTSGWARDWIVLITATTPFFVYWTFGGLETTLTSFILIITISTFGSYLDPAQTDIKWQHLVPPTLATLAFVLTRPEMPFVLNAVLGCAVMLILPRAFFGHRQNAQMLKRILVLWFVCMIATVGIFAFRLGYFGSLFPQPVLAKSTGLSLQGLYYGTLYVFFTLHSGMLVIACLAIVNAISAGYLQIKNPTPNTYLLLTVLFALVYLGFILFSGGDWMEAGRFLAPIIPLTSIFLILPLAHLRAKIIPIAILVGWFCIAGFDILRLATTEATSAPAWSGIDSPASYDASGYSWFEQKNLLNVHGIMMLEQISPLIDKVVGHTQSTGTKVTIYTGQMGIVPYYLAQNYPHQIEFIDRLGLTDRVITGCPLTNNLFHCAIGINISYNFLFSNLERLHDECQIKKPDLILDIISPGSVSPESSGYQVVFVQEGQIKPSTPWPKGIAASAYYFIAVRNDLLPLLSDENGNP